MGRLRALTLGIVKGEPAYTPLCPKEHDPESLARLLGKWRYKAVMMVPGAHDVALANAQRFHDDECVRGPEEKWCRCDWCNKRREMVKNGND